jgi:rod shape-determining protein MreC
LGGLYPPGFPVAKVIPQGVEFKQGAPSATVKAAPLVNYEATRDVLLIWRKPGIPEPQPLPAPEPKNASDATSDRDTKKDSQQTNESKPETPVRQSGGGR